MFWFHIDTTFLLQPSLPIFFPIGLLNCLLHLFSSTHAPTLHQFIIFLLHLFSVLKDTLENAYLLFTHFPFYCFFFSLLCTVLCILPFSEPFVLLTKEHSFQWLGLLNYWNHFLASSASGHTKIMKFLFIQHHAKKSLGNMREKLKYNLRWKGNQK